MLWRRLVASQARSITAAAFVVAAASLVSRILGVLRDRVLASEFGAGVELDIYYAAFRIPDMIYNLIVIGALSAGFIPVLAKFKDNKEQAWALVSASIYWLSIIITGLAVICGLSMPWLVAILTPGFDSATQSVVVWMSLVMLLSPLLLGISGVLGSVLQTYQQFFLYSLGPILYNIGIIFGALFLVPYLGLYGLAVGVVLGALLHLLINVPGMYLLGYRFTWRAKNHPALRQVVSLTVPRLG